MAKHDRGWIREQELRRRAKLLRLAHMYGLLDWPHFLRQKDRKPCSCWMCGNQRRHFGTKPIQEQRLDLRDQEDHTDA